MIDLLVFMVANAGNKLPTSVRPSPISHVDFKSVPLSYIYRLNIDYTVHGCSMNVSIISC